MKKLILILSLVTLMLVSYLSYDYFSNLNAENSNDFVVRTVESVSQAKPVTSTPTITTQTTVAPKLPLTITELRTLLQKTPAFSQLPKNAIIVLSFFDGNGKTRNDLYFTIYGTGEIKNSLDPKYDFMIITGDYYINSIKSSNNLCSALKDIKNKKDYRINRRISAFSATLKYRSLLRFKSCIY
ncbi:MAG: hypothetical protein WC413_01030 [Candidatus Nanoarchaeia archaeon]